MQPNVAIIPSLIKTQSLLTVEAVSFCVTHESTRLGVYFILSRVQTTCRSQLGFDGRRIIGQKCELVFNRDNKTLVWVK